MNYFFTSFIERSLENILNSVSFEKKVKSRFEITTCLKFDSSFQMTYELELFVEIIWMYQCNMPSRFEPWQNIVLAFNNNKFEDSSLLFGDYKVHRPKRW